MMANAHADKPIRIVVLGGGTGSFVVLSALKTLTPKITAVVNMCDDGGSTGVLRDELGVLPPGDARQCLVALSERPEVRDLFNYRFDTGSLAGHSLGNMILSGLELQHGSFEKAIEVAANILRIRGKVVPAALGSHQLVMRDGGIEVVGQHAIDMRTITSRDATVRLEPLSTINPGAAQAIEHADLVVISPGSLYTSLLPIFSVDGVATAFGRTKAQVIMIANLVNKPTHTVDWHVVDYVTKIEEYIGAGVIDAVLYNTEPISDDLLLRYAEEGEFPVVRTSARFSEITAKPIGANLVSPTLAEQDQADVAIRRTLIRHDPDRLAASTLNIYRAYVKVRLRGSTTSR